MAPLGALAHKRPAGDDAGDGSRDDKKSRKAKVRARRATAKEAKAAKVAKDSEDLATLVAGLTWPGSAQQARVAKAFPCRRRGAHGGRLRSQGLRRSSGDNGCHGRALTRARARAKESLALAN